jgi:hypothetical protein
VGADGGQLGPLPIATFSSEECCGVWTPGGSHFMFESKRAGRTDLWTLAEGIDLLGRSSVRAEPLTAGAYTFRRAGS